MGASLPCLSLFQEFETDDESVISSQASEFGSPVCSTPHRPVTPLSVSDTSCSKTPIPASCAQVFLSCALYACVWN